MTETVGPDMVFRCLAVGGTCRLNGQSVTLREKGLWLDGRCLHLTAQLLEPIWNIDWPEGMQRARKSNQ